EYVEYLYVKTKVELIYQYSPLFSKTELHLKSPYSMIDLYRVLKTRYNGTLRDQLLSYCLVNSSEIVRFFGGVDPHEFRLCMDDAFFTLETPALIRLIAHERRVSSLGERAYDFELPDVEG